MLVQSDILLRGKQSNNVSINKLPLHEHFIDFKRHIISFIHIQLIRAVTIVIVRSLDLQSEHIPTKAVSSNTAYGEVY